jgi:cell division protease FtsH
VVARGTPGFSGADLENLINEAALTAARQNKEQVDSSDLEAARDKIMMGVERKSMIMSEDEKKTTAWHEAGHTLVALLLPNSDPLHKVTIIPRGMALGVTQYLPTEDRYTYSKDYFLTRLAILLGGRVAEENCLNQLTTGAGNDIERATKLAYNMVCRYGMSKKLGPLNFRKQEDQIFLGREIAQHRDYSEETARIIDSEVNSLIQGAYDTASNLINKHKDTLKVLAELLLEKETLDATEVIEIARDAITSEGLPIPEIGESFDAKSRKKPEKEPKKTKMDKDPENTQEKAEEDTSSDDGDLK